MLPNGAESRSCRASRAGFTLIELLVVVAILAVLIALLIPSLGKAKDQAKIAGCAANLRSITQLTYMYSNSFESFPWGEYNVNNSTFNTRWPTLLINTASSNFGTTWSNSSAAGYSKYLKAMICPEVGGDPNPTNTLVQYSCHPLVLPDYDYIKKNGINSNPVPFKPAQVRRADLALYWDTSLSLVPGTSYWKVKTDNAAADYLDNMALKKDSGHLMFPTPGKLITNSIDMTSANSGPVNGDDATGGYANAFNIRFRHRGDTKANVAFNDGSVQAFTLNAGLPAQDANKTDFIRRNIIVQPD